MKILVAQMNPIVGDLSGNLEKILTYMDSAKRASVDLLLFSELCLLGYPPQDLLLLPHFIDAVDESLKKIIVASQHLTVVVGTVRKNPTGIEKPLYNSAAIIANGTLLGFQDKTLLPTYDVFDERRYFEPASSSGHLWNLCGKKVGITICEDIWPNSDCLKFSLYRENPLEHLKKQQPDFVLNLSASPYSFAKSDIRLKVASKAAQTVGCPLVLCNQIGGNDSLIFDGHSLCVDAQGHLIHYAKGFEEDEMIIEISEDISELTTPPLAPLEKTQDPWQDLYRALVLGVRDYFSKLGFKKACLGLSGGIDSALVACIAKEALGKENVLAVGMPSRYSSKGSLLDSEELAKNLGITFQQISIEPPFQSFLDGLNPFFEHRLQGVTEENLQARIRGMLLMAISNQLGHIVLSTGNKSELAMGYSTLYGDTCGGLSVISDLTKRQVYALSRWINRERIVIPLNILEKPPSAELRPNQKDSDSLPDYEIVDHVLQDYVEEHLDPDSIAKRHGYPLSLVNDLVKRIHLNEYKRRQNPPGLRISEKAFSVGRLFPIVQKWEADF